MSATTTETQELLHDYDIHLSSGTPETSSINTPSSVNSGSRFRSPRDAPRVQVDNPPNWTNDYRQTPPYRPANRGLDISQRPWGTNPAEQFFIVHMFEGVCLQATGNWLWRKTIGRYNESLWRAQVGGEF
ncbi:hypothetical protein B0J13DRAFT_673479 [Dactylonectria estremocensis]|uniref:Uncharacterized protein n=1 Tax=Dactylonectria estremocensis TaxID=1079267 RepID=A0A9P9F4E9_9HYPO|nr:hypothetical protein B0J13DRAFT_673479 [Dactylonectria estremocensis]